MFGRKYIIEKCTSAGWVRCVSSVTAGEFKNKAAAYRAIEILTQEAAKYGQGHTLAPMRVRPAK